MTRPYATTTVKFTTNLDARESYLASASFDPSDSATYHYSESIAVYDSLGVTHTLESFFVKTGINEWSVFATVDGIPTYTIGTPPTPNGTITYPANGTGINPTFNPLGGIPVLFVPLDDNGTPTGAAIPATINLDVRETTQFGSNFTSSTEQDGGFIADVTLTGTQNNDNLTGGRSDADTVVFNYSTEDIISIDASNYSSNGVVTIAGPEGIDTLTSIEVLQFTDFTLNSPQLLVSMTAGDKTITGSDYGNIIIPGAATNKILAGGGDDYIAGVSIGETIDGGNGIDSVQFGFASSEVTSVTRKLDGSVVLSTQQGATTLSNIEKVVFQSESAVSLPDFIALKNADKPVFTLPDSNGGNIEATPELYSGPVDFIQYQLLGDTSGNVVTGSQFNDFLNLQGGDDAANGGDGQDVLDGGTGSNFLTGGAGSDTFYLDGRSGSVTWSTITDFGGDTINIWGWQEGVSKLLLSEDAAGAEGFKGATFHYDLNNDGSIDTSITFSNLSLSQVPDSSAEAIQENGYLLFS